MSSSNSNSPKQGTNNFVDVHSEFHGPESNDTLDSLMQLSFIQQKQKKYAASEKNYRALLKARLAELGPEAALTLLIMNNLGSVLKYQDQCSKECATLLRIVCETRSRCLGPTHQLSLKSLNFLAEHLSDQGEDDEADALHKEYHRLLGTATDLGAALAGTVDD